MTDSNGAIIQQLKSSTAQSTNNKSDRINQSELIEDADKTAYFDAIEWGKHYQLKYQEYKEQARLLISNKQIKNSPVELPDMESLLFNEMHPQPISGANGHKSQPK